MEDFNEKVCQSLNRRGYVNLRQKELNSFLQYLNDNNVINQDFKINLLSGTWRVELIK